MASGARAHGGESVEACHVPSLASNGLYAPYEQLQPKDWQLLTPPGEQLGEGYRRCCTSVLWVGEVLAARMLGAKDTWNRPAFFVGGERRSDNLEEQLEAVVGSPQSMKRV